MSACSHGGGYNFHFNPLASRRAEPLHLHQETVAGLPLVYEPGERFSYAHDNDWLVFVCEEASGMDFEAFCQENIFGWVRLAHDAMLRA